MVVSHIIKEAEIFSERNVQVVKSLGISYDEDSVFWVISLPNHSKKILFYYYSSLSLILFFPLKHSFFVPKNLYWKKNPVPASDQKQ